MFSLVCISACFAALVPVTGCGANNPSISGEDALEPGLASVSGSVYGGAQPVNNATVTLYAPATSGYGGTPTAIVTTTTNSNGSFTLPRPYTCPSNSADVYLEATGGDAGSGTNSAIALAVLLGPCSSLSAATQVKLNEATTVAAAFALAQFANVSSTGTGIGTSSTNLVGLNNAYATASKLVNPTTGAPNGATSLTGVVPPTAVVNTLANILGYCVNGNGGSCGAVFAAATPPGGTAPKDTFQAAIDIALNPTNGLTPLFGLSSSYAPFQPGLANQPTDFALGIQYNGSVIATCAFTNGVAIDQSGNAWVGCGTGNAHAGLTEISPAGTYLSPSSGFALPLPNGTPFTGGSGIAIDANGAAWLTNASENAVYQISASGNVSRYAPSGYLNGPTGIAVDNGNNEVYIANTGNDPAANDGSADYLGQTVVALNLNGTYAYTVSQESVVYGPTDVVNANGNYLFADFTGNSTASPSIAAFVPIASGQTGTLYPYSTNTSSGDLAADAANNGWVIDNDGIDKWVAVHSSGSYSYTPMGTVITPSITPVSVMFDGNDRLLIAGTSSNSQGQLAFYDDSTNLLYTLSANNTIPATPYDPTGLDIDASGNVWISGAPLSGNGYLTELVGVAGPVPMPKAAAGLLSKVGARP